MTTGAEIKIRGVVQGVGYRYFCCTHARTLSLTGWVKNALDGSVVVLAEGDRSAIEAFIEELRIGPMAATVTSIDIHWTPFTGKYQTFQVAR